MIKRSSKADIDIQDKSGRAALHYAVEQSAIEVVKQLLDKGANVNIEGYYGITPLDVALDEGHDDIAELLKSRGAIVERFLCLEDVPGQPWPNETINRIGKC